MLVNTVEVVILTKFKNYLFHNQYHNVLTVFTLTFPYCFAEQNKHRIVMLIKTRIMPILEVLIITVVLVLIAVLALSVRLIFTKKENSGVDRAETILMN